MAEQKTTDTKAPKGRAKVGLTPSQAALEAVGPTPESEDPATLLAHGEKYLQAKLKVRHGT